MLELCGAVNLEQLEVQTDTLYVAPGGQNPITENQVNITGGSMVIFEWIDTTRHGQLLKNGEPLRPGQKWTASDLASGIIQYKNESDFDQENILLSAESPDGQWSGVIKVPVQLDEMVLVRDHDLAGKITIYPNPADTYIAIKTKPDIKIGQIHIRDIQGKELYRYQTDSPGTRLTIPTASWPAGIVYISLITPEGDQWSDKIIIH